MAKRDVAVLPGERPQMLYLEQENHGACHGDARLPALRVCDAAGSGADAFQQGDEQRKEAKPIAGPQARHGHQQDHAANEGPARRRRHRPFQMDDAAGQNGGRHRQDGSCGGDQMMGGGIG
ncbi:hypothetical protein [Novosphingobium panipatense]|uniref:hypothetical protein n=1 Tax=Novosphingobium panipatense TaxID=428991 RepID=UPI00361520CA